MITAPPKRAEQYKIYKIIVREGDPRGLIVGRFEVAARDRNQAQRAGERWCLDGGRHPGFNAHVSVMRKIVDREPATILVAQ